jgi:hypothetical protein
MARNETQSKVRKRELRALMLAALCVASLLSGLWACGEEDLIFPGMIPPTATPTQTEEATETEEPDDG